MRYRLLAVLALVLMAQSSAWANRRVDSTNEYAVIHDGEGAYRYLFKVEGVRALDRDAAISHAELSFDLTGPSVDRKVHLSISPVTSPWAAGSADWTSGWRRAGGDFDRELSARATLGLSSGGRAVFDVTGILKEWLEQGVEYHGFILTTQTRDGEGIRGEDLARFSGLENATLDVSYRSGSRRMNRRR